MQKMNTLKYLSHFFGMVLCLTLGFSSLQAQCDASVGILTAPAICFKGDTAATIQTAKAANTIVPEGYSTIYVLTSGDDLVIENAGQFPYFEVAPTGKYTIHTLVFDPATLDLSTITFGVTTGVDVNGLLVQGGGDICAALDVTGVPFSFEACEEPCFAGAGTLTPNEACLEDGIATLSATRTTPADVPAGYSVLYVLTTGDTLTIQDVSATPEFTVDEMGMYTIHTLVYDSTTLDLSIVVPGVTTGVDVNGLLIQGGGSICGALDVAGASFMVAECPCEAFAGTLTANDDGACLDGDGSMTTITASVDSMPNVPEGFSTLYVLTTGDTLAIQGVSATPSFDVMANGMYTIHTLVYDSTTLDLSIVVPGVTTGFDVNGLLEQGGGDICASLDVAGATFMIADCPCEAFAGTLTANSFDCLDTEMDMATTTISASVDSMPNVPSGYTTLYVLTSGDTLAIQGVSATPSFDVAATGMYTIHTLVYDSTTLDLSIVVPGVTTGFDVNGLLEQGGGDICASLDVAGAVFMVEDCVCEAYAGTLTANEFDCLEGTMTTTISASVDSMPNVPEGYSTLYVLTTGDTLTIQGVSASPEFEVDAAGMYTIHTLVYDSTTLDLSIVVPGVTTGVDVNGLLVQGGGDICAALDVAGASFMVEACPCEVSAGTLTADEEVCFTPADTEVSISATHDMMPMMEDGFLAIYVLTRGEDLVIVGSANTPEFQITEMGDYTIHTLVYNPSTLDLTIIEPGVTTGFDVNSLLQQGGGDICGSLDVAGAKFSVGACPCDADAGTLAIDTETCADLATGEATITASVATAPVIPEGFTSIYVLTSGEGLVIEGVSATPSFTVNGAGRYTIHTLVYDSTTLDLGIVEFGVTTGVDVNGLLFQGGGAICGALDVAGAAFDVEDCPCEADAGTLLVESQDCIEDGGVGMVNAIIENAPVIPAGYASIYVLTSGDDLVIEGVSATPSFEVSSTGKYTIHTLVYDPATLDLNIVELGVTTGFDVNGLLIQGGGEICGALDVAGASFEVEACPCDATVGRMVGNPTICLNGQYPVPISATIIDRPNRPRGFRILYVMTTGDDLVIQRVSSTPSFTIGQPGQYRIHTLVYNPNTLDLGIVEFGVTTGGDINSLLVQGGGTICGALDVTGVDFEVKNCSERAAGAARTQLFPNPSTNLVNVNFGSAAFTGDIKVIITDIQGSSTQTLQFDQGTTNAEIEVNTLPQGMYVLRIQYADATEEIIRFSKQ
ncbi:MAG: hypothetical protein Sapg2KO_52830 [Saprospiraceae bacterium]